jgi:pyruvate formate lyase activating enzyme
MDKNFGIKGFISTSLVDWPGKICSILFLAGCGFRCPACHNPALVLNPGSLPDYPLEEICRSLSNRSKWIDGVTVTGGEPTTRTNLSHLLGILREYGVKIKLDTNGSNPQMLEDLTRSHLIDAVSMDVKAPLDSAKYSTVAGVPVDIEAIKRSVALLLRSPIEVTFRTTAIPGLVEEPELAKIKEDLLDAPRFIIQSFRSAETLDPSFMQIREFDRLRVDNMRERFEVPAPDEMVVRKQACGGSS